MPSRFAWVDFAETDRRRMLDAVRLFKEQETRDELGIGAIRDAFADYFFPGTSTIQTRVRYMLFVPWIYRRLEDRKTPASKITNRARQDEIRLITALLDGGEKEGVIGRRAKSKLQRLPSNIYWSGLGAWGIRRFPGSQDAYHRSLDGFYRRAQSQNRPSREREREIDAADFVANWDPALPPSPANFLKTATFALTPEEARYLQDRLHVHHRNSLLTHLCDEKTLIEANFLWEHPLAKRVSPRLQQTIGHAQNFSETLYGAALLYNLLLARKRGDPDLIADYQARFNDWLARIETREAALQPWYRNLDAFWETEALHIARISPLTKNFVGAWLQLVFDAAPRSQLADNQTAYLLISDRETLLKRNRARLENPRALELWTGHSGDQQLDFRWRTARVMAADIWRGLHPQEAQDA